MHQVYRRYLTYGLVSLLVSWIAMAIGLASHPILSPQKASLITARSMPKSTTLLPGGGRILIPGHDLVALYGSPNEPVLGALGEQPIAATIDRAKQLAAEYQSLSKTKILPTLEIIASVASASPTDNNDYSREVEPASLLPWIHAAQTAGVYIVLDLQPGRSNFLDQAKQYANLLRFPNVGLALDPEWRLKPDQVHLTQIGSVDVDEINQTSAWLARLTTSHKLPQKLLLIHQFRQDMIVNRPALDVSLSELAYVIQMDGSGSPQQKQATWLAINQDTPARISFGWKNFYKQDTPMLSTVETMAVTPVPSYVSYQ